VSLAGHASGYGSYVLPFVIAGVGISMSLPCVTAAGLDSGRWAWGRRYRSRQAAISSPVKAAQSDA
jgi:hypothetical protein